MTPYIKKTKYILECPECGHTFEAGTGNISSYMYSEYETDVTIKCPECSYVQSI